MRGVCDSAVAVLESPLRGESNTLAISRVPVLPSGCFGTVGASDFGYFELINFRNTQPALPRRLKGPAGASSLQVRRYRRDRKGRAQNGSLLPFLYHSFIHYFTPVYPDAVQSRSFAPRKPAAKSMRHGTFSPVKGVRAKCAAITAIRRAAVMRSSSTRARTRSDPR
jgi:hypothetical protein